MPNVSGHRIEEIPEVPIVVDDKVEGYKKTKEAVLLLKKLKAWNDIKKVSYSQTLILTEMLQFTTIKSFWCIFLVSRFTLLSVCVPVRVRWGTEGVSSVKDHASSSMKTTVWHELSETSLVRKEILYLAFASHEHTLYMMMSTSWSVFMNPMILVEVLTLIEKVFVCLDRCKINNHKRSLLRRHTAVREQTGPVKACSRWTHWTLLHLDRGCLPQAG